MTPETASATTTALCERAPIIPVLVLDDPSLAVDLAHALVEGGLSVLEVTLRTPNALKVIHQMAGVEGAITGAGTVLTEDQVKSAKEAGAEFAVAPGATDRLLNACEAQDLPLLPGAATASEAMRLLERGYSMQKFFPAEASGGAAALRAIGAPIPQVRFCPTGGISTKNAADYLALSNVVCCGGSWVAPADLVAKGDWQAITALARDAVALRGSQAR